MEPLKWSAAEYEHETKTSDWFWVLGIVAVSAAVASVLFENILFALLILISAFVLALFAARKPNVVDFEISDRGVRIDDKVFPFSTLDHFGIVSNAKTPKLYLQSKKTFAPHFIIPIVGVNEEAIRIRLSRKLREEEEQEETFAERIMEVFGL